MRYATSADVRVLHHSVFEDERGRLIPIADGVEPVAVSRSFLVFGSENAERGGHAHLECSQLLIAVNGSIRVDFTDGQHGGTVWLTGPEIALFLPPMIWATEFFQGRASCLLVLCDRPYEVEDYVRDRNHFMLLRGLEVS